MIPRWPEDLRPLYPKKYIENHDGLTKNIDALYVNMNKLFSRTLMPKAGDSGNVHAYVINLLYECKQNRPIHVMDFIFNEIKYACTEQKWSLPFAPFIHTLIDGVTQDQNPPFVKDVTHGVYTMKITKEKIDHGNNMGKQVRFEAGTSASHIARYNKKQNLILTSMKSLFDICISNSIEIAHVKQHLYNHYPPKGVDASTIQIPVWENPLANWASSDGDDTHAKEQTREDQEDDVHGNDADGNADD